ncbi:MAG: nucleotide sugar dehydrogenase [Pseudodesulfovibrio sp.]|nr:MULTISPECIES: nucleotide sugar dehydrogenase [Pseudodesulfovibrio]MBU4192128.1 nucleotide sugar dehydrogenase [Pseudomonadota bacterium]MBU4244202.1 nucleotide sugar dehydrogenase [Pseudomonadota bacterium]MBU4379940.1 nucleotide sugar dehydrogenase [Pseudomonadota bacterium]MBU4476252.1 nucleotide sugar dehydrogenase [Pseudomonadota bacterium]MBU4515858.1 nucleotide sugar dehydrogenase [Pseudomonadota bacterium]
MITFDRLQSKEDTIAVVGLGYVGLPLAVALGRHFRVIGVDVSDKRVRELVRRHDRTGEVDFSTVTDDVDLIFTSDLSNLASARLILVAVPTPIDEYRSPDLRPVTGASESVGTYLQPGSVVVYESTVFPGLTEDICVPILEDRSGLVCGRDFCVGYSPERINPGDKVHRLETIVKVVAGQDEATGRLLQAVYGIVVEAGTHLAADIRTAEAAKVIENTQRDLNIALMNELAMIFDRMGIDTLDVLEAAGTKWNFLPFRPGLVGGHCIGVDPYYLTFKAEAMGFHPQVILAGRQTNDSMGKFIAEAAVKRLIRADVKIKGARVGVLGVTFKENVPDLRNTRVVDILAELADYGMVTLIHDAMADPEEARHELGIELCALDAMRDLDALVLAVSHDQYRDIPLAEIKEWFADPARALVVDVKGFFDRAELEALDITYWRL